MHILSSVYINKLNYLRNILSSVYTNKVNYLRHILSSVYKNNRGAYCTKALSKY